MKSRIARVGLVAAFALVARGSEAAPGEDPAGEGRPAIQLGHNPAVLMQTTLGDLLLRLNRDAAPQTVTQVVRLIEAEAYDGTHFFRVHPGFIAQVSIVEDRYPPLSSEQEALLQPIPGEFGNGLVHTRGVLSMARELDDPSSARSSFSILLGTAPHLDEDFVVFGQVEKGLAVLDALVSVPRNAQYQPNNRLTITRMRMVPEAELARLALAPPPAPEALSAESTKLLETLRLGTICMLLIASLGFVLPRWFGPGVQQTMMLANVCVGTVLVVAANQETGRVSPWLAGVLFCAFIAMFPAMAFFETSSTNQ